MSVDAARQAEQAEERFLDELRRRVAWQAEAAYAQPPEQHRPRWSLADLERLVAERGREFPDRVDDWRWQVCYLRFHAAADGTLPPAFDGFVDAAFSGLV